MEIYGVNLRIQSEYKKMRTRKTPYFDTFHAVESVVFNNGYGWSITSRFGLECLVITVR